MQSIDGIINEPTLNFVGKDGFFWWVGEVEDNEDPMELGRVKCRVLGYYTNVRGGTTSDLPTKDLPWAVVLQHTSQAGNDGQGESSGQLQPGAIVMGFFLDGESAQMPIILGVMRVKKSAASNSKNIFAFTGENMEPGSQGHVNPAMYSPADPVYSVKAEGNSGGTGDADTDGSGGATGNKQRGSDNNSVNIPGSKTTAAANGPGSPKNVGTTPGVPGSTANPKKPIQPSKPIPAANGVGGPWKSMEYKLSYLMEDIGSTAATLVKSEDGNFLDIIEGKIHTAQELTAKVQNFLTGIFSQVISAIRKSVTALTEDLDPLALFGDLFGIPYSVMTKVQEAAATLLSSLCNFDQDLLGYIANPMSAVQGVIDGFLDGALDKASMVAQGVNDTIDQIFCSVQGILDQVSGVVDLVKGIVSGVGEATKVIEQWQSGEGIFSEDTDGFLKGVDGLTSLMAMFIGTIQGDCGRGQKSAEDTVGFFPLYGATKCTPEEIAKANKALGLDKAKGECGGGGSGGSGGGSGSGSSLIDSIYAEADPYLTAAKTFVDGSYELHIGTPGRQSSVKKQANGTTHTAVNLNNNTFAEYNARKQIKEKYPDASAEDVEKKVKEFKKTSTDQKGDTGNLVADDINYAGNLTQHVTGDKCEQIDANNIINVEGDYRLKVTGNFHLEVGGSFQVCAENAPQTVDPKSGEKTSQDKIQKSSLRFASDLDIDVSSAKIKLSTSEFEMDSTVCNITGNNFESTYTNQSYSGGDISLTGSNSINVTTLLYNIMINPEDTAKNKAGIQTSCLGNIITTMEKSQAHPIPTYDIINEEGPTQQKFGGGGYILEVVKGVKQTTVKEGPITETAEKGPITIEALKGSMTLDAKETMKCTAETIYLN